MNIADILPPLPTDPFRDLTQEEIKALSLELRCCYQIFGWNVSVKPTSIDDWAQIMKVKDEEEEQARSLFTFAAELARSAAPAPVAGEGVSDALDKAFAAALNLRVMYTAHRVESLLRAVRTRVECRDCQGTMDATGGTEKAIAAWNRRAPMAATGKADERDAADAGRYRWLRNNREARKADGTMCYATDEDGSLLYNEQLDAAIDAAMGALSTPETTPPTQPKGEV